MRNLIICTVTVLAALLSGCSDQSQGNVPAAQSTPEEIPEAVAPWSVAVEDLICSTNGSETQLCHLVWGATNASSEPVEYYGYTYVVTDAGATYQSTDNYAEYRWVNPGERAGRTRFRGNYFKLPSGICLTELFKADTPRGPRIVSYIIPSGAFCVR